MVSDDSITIEPIFRVNKSRTRRLIICTCSFGSFPFALYCGYSLSQTAAVTTLETTPSMSATIIYA